MTDTLIADITKSKGRKFLYHFTRVSNLPAIAYLDTLLSSGQMNPHSTGERRSEPEKLKYIDFTVTINAHLRIPDMMIDPTTTQEQFRAGLDQHVFFWPTLRDCQKMMDTYTRREPEAGFAVLKLDAIKIMTNHYTSTKLSKYDSGSSPRFPANCSYKKSEAMFLPLQDFKRVSNRVVPTQASEIKEVLIADRVQDVSNYLLAIYIEDDQTVPDSWRMLARPWQDLRA
ncbi:hypothetical protein LJR153_004233 [Paenibacillus sp. LjRoot153]|uniref:DUF7002 family protein n=1 Tax=Paenibacillus sp. LjRoot153 TaxID=3342270 RepID=UPI003ED14997